MAMHEEVWNVATSQRSDVGSTNVQVNKRQRLDVGSTNVQVNKRQRRDVSTSQRLNVATLQHRDVSTSYAFSALKANGGADLEASGGVRTRARNSKAGVTPTSKKCP